MANSKLIVVEGPQGAGKTTVTDFIRHGLKYTNLYRLCGTADSTPTGKQKAKDMYFDLLEYIKKMENKSINLLFDRTFFTEEIYSRLKSSKVRSLVPSLCILLVLFLTVATLYVSKSHHQDI